MSKEGAPDKQICLLFPAENLTEEDMANAVLIRAAPDLLAALGAAMPYLNNIELGNDDDEHLTNVVRAARAAVAKGTDQH